MRVAIVIVATLAVLLGTSCLRTTYNRCTEMPPDRECELLDAGRDGGPDANVDAGPSDGGVDGAADASPDDAGTVDAGAVDAGAVDASSDAGTDAS